MIWGMTIRIGTIQEMTGRGFEILVDSETRTQVLGEFFDGNFLSSTSAAPVDGESSTLIA